MRGHDAPDSGSSLIEPLVAALLLVTTLTPLAGVLYRVAYATDAGDTVLADLAAADAADAARAACAVTPSTPAVGSAPLAADLAAPAASWTVRVTPTEGAGVDGVYVEVVSRRGRLLSSVSAPCLPVR